MPQVDVGKSGADLLVQTLIQACPRLRQLALSHLRRAIRWPCESTNMQVVSHLKVLKPLVKGLMWASGLHVVFEVDSLDMHLTGRRRAWCSS